MAKIELDYITFTYEEMVSLFILFECENGPVGIDIPELKMFGKEKEAYLQAHSEQLIGDGFLIRTDEGLKADPDVERLFNVLINHQLVFLLDRSYPESNESERFVFEVCGNEIVEHIFHSNGNHTFVFFPDTRILSRRIRDLCPISDEREADPGNCIIQRELMFSLVDQIKQGDYDPVVKRLVLAGLSEDKALNCIDGIRDPDVVLALIGMVIDDQTVVRAESLCVYGNETSLWGVWPVENEERERRGEYDVFLFECIQSDVVDVFVKWIDQLRGLER